MKFIYNDEQSKCYECFIAAPLPIFTSVKYDKTAFLSQLYKVKCRKALERRKFPKTRPFNHDKRQKKKFYENQLRFFLANSITVINVDDIYITLAHYLQDTMQKLTISTKTL